MRMEIKKTGINGEGIGYLNRKPVFVTGCFAGETAEVKITDDRGKYLRGRAEKIIVRSPHRTGSICPYYQDCGSCPFIDLKYRAQLKYKEEILQETLQKYCDVKIKCEHIVPSEQYGYRNKINLPVAADKKGKLHNAMYRAGSNIPVQIDECPLHEEELERVRKAVLKALNRASMTAYQHSSKSGIRQLIIRGFEEFQVVLITGTDVISEKLINDIMSIDKVVSLWQGINIQKNPVNMMPDKITLLSGKPEINTEICGYQVSLHPQAFFQLNRNQAVNIYEKVNELINEKVSLAVEAYCGIGVMSMMIHDKAEEVIGVEIDARAVESARNNVRANGIDNVSFRCNDAGSELIKLSRKRKIDLLIADPPRTGMSENFIQCLLKSPVRKIIYVSCNPATLARNIKELSGKYEVERIIPYDMFPNTPHIEAITVLRLKEKR